MFNLTSFLHHLILNRTGHFLNLFRLSPPPQVPYAPPPPSVREHVPSHSNSSCKKMICASGVAHKLSGGGGTYGKDPIFDSSSNCFHWLYLFSFLLLICLLLITNNLGCMPTTKETMAITYLILEHLPTAVPSNLPMTN